MDVFQKLVDESSSLWSSEYESTVRNCLKNWVPGQRKSRNEYHIREKYALRKFAGIEKVVLKKDARLIATKENVLNIIRDYHVTNNHVGEKKTYLKICENYGNVSRKLVGEFIKQCERCVEKLRKKEKTGIVVRPILAKDFNCRGQVDLIDMQSLPDGPYRFIMHY